MSKDKENLCLFPVKYSFQLLFGLNKHTMKWFFNDIAEANTHRIVVLPKNSYQGLLARNELEQADRRVHKFVRQAHAQFIWSERNPSIIEASLCGPPPEGYSSLRYRDPHRSSP